jgi:tetratricopeptide (TPR) repeat protein
VNNLADAYEELGRREEAVALLRRALDLNREVGHQYGEAVALGNLGAALVHLHRAEEAAPILEEACAAYAKIDFRRAGYVLHSLGECFGSLGRDDEALDCLARSVACHQAVGNRLQQAFTLKSLAVVQASRGLIAQARESRTQAAAIFDELGDVSRLRRFVTNMADLSLSVQWANTGRAGLLSPRGDQGPERTTQAC